MTYDEQVNYVLFTTNYDPVTKAIQFPKDDEWLAGMRAVTDKALDHALHLVRQRDVVVVN